MAKYTDEQIKKALECLHKRILKSKFAEEVTESEIMALVNSLDLINQQETEIEQWKEKANRYQNLWCESEEDIQTAKSEAIKEFAERLKEKAYYCENKDGKDNFVVDEMVIDNLVREKVGESK